MEKYILEPLLDPIVWFFSWVIGAVFLLGFILVFCPSRGSSPFSRHLPSTLTSVGVVGTFVGIYYGLVDFNVTDIDGSIPPLLAGLKIAFSTSILGMVSSVILKMLQGLRAPKVGKETVSASDIYTVMAEIRDEAKNSRTRNEELLVDVKNAISADSDASLVTQMQKLRSSNQDASQELRKATVDGFEQMNAEFVNFAEKMAENNSKALIEALQEVIRDFNTKISEQFGDNFKQLNEAVGQLLVWQENYKNQTEAMVDQFSLAQKGISDTRDAVVVIGEQTREIPNTMSELKVIIQLANDQLVELKAHLEAVAGLRDKAEEAFPVIENTLDKLTTEFSQAVTHSTDMISTLLDEQASALQQASAHSLSMIEKSMALHQETLESLETGMSEMPEQVEAILTKVETNLSAAVDTFTKGVEVGLQSQSNAIAESLGSMREALQTSLSDTNEVIQQSFEVFDQQMQEEIKRTIETMGSHLASLSNKFVEDYSPLTDKLRRVIEMSRSL